MTRIIAFVLAVAAATGSAALASESHGALPAETTQAITKKLSAEGYELRQVVLEDGFYEAYALKDGKRYEIYLDSNLDIVRTRVKN